MNILGLTISRTPSVRKEMHAVDSSRGWYPITREPYAGAWQRNDEEPVDNVLSYGPVFACQTLIASDIAKMRCRVVQLNDDRIWEEVDNNTSHSPVLRRPNHFQNRIQFFENWVLSKLSRGNTYLLKARDARGIVQSLYALDPCRVRPMVSQGGEVFYELRKDLLSRQTDDILMVPAREIIHDRFNCLFHPLVGLSPLYAATLSASQGLRIQRGSSRFFKNGARPSGILTAPGEIKQQTADELKAYWETGFSGDNTAKIAVLGDGLKYEPMTMTSVDAQLVEQLGMTAKEVASVYHVPAYKIGAAEPPSFNNIEALDRAYYSQCLQILIEAVELGLDEGLEFPTAPRKLGAEFDLDDLLRMDTSSQTKTLSEGVKGGLVKPNEARRKLNLAPTPGGDTCYLQQQNYSLEALAKRDSSEDPFKTASAPEPPEPEEDSEEEDEQRAAAFVADFSKSLTEMLDAA